MPTGAALSPSIALKTISDPKKNTAGSQTGTQTLQSRRLFKEKRGSSPPREHKSSVNPTRASVQHDTSSVVSVVETLHLHLNV